MAKKKTLKQRFPNASMRLTNKTVDEYQRLSKNAKAKIRRIEKNYGDEVVIVGKDGEPKIVKTEQLFNIPSLEDFQSKKAFNEWVENQQHFIKNGNYRFQRNDHGAVGSKNLLHKIERDTALARLKAKKKIEEQENKPIFNQKGEQVATVGQRLEMMKEPMTGISVPAKFNFSKMRNNQSLVDKGTRMRERSSEKYYDRRLTIMRDNFIYIISQVFNSEANDYIDKIKNMGLDEFYDMYLMYIDDMDFNYYDSDGTLYEDNTKSKQLEKLESDLQSYSRGDFYSLRDTDF
jgi:hypothetical protein